MGRQAAMLIGGVSGLIAGVLFGLFSPAHGLADDLTLACGGGLVGSITGGLLGAIGGQMGSRDSRKNYAWWAAVAGLLLGALGGFQWRFFTSFLDPLRRMLP